MDRGASPQTRPLPRRRNRLLPWLLLGAAALLVLGGASYWSAGLRALDAPRAYPASAAPSPPTAGMAAATVQGFADQDRVAVAPRPTAVRAPAGAAVRAVPTSAPRGSAAETVPVVAPPPADDGSPAACARTAPAVTRPLTCPPTPGPLADPHTAGGSR
jgi:hypothetical protein